MTVDKILKEIQAIDTSVMSDGLSFSDHYIETKNITAIEQLLFYCNVKKYYYNYTEKRLRELECNIDNIINFEGEDNAIFTCKDVEDETSIDIKAHSFADKIICFEDYHKTVTYDLTTKHYECFYVDITQKKVNEFFKEARKAIPPELQQFIHQPTQDTPTEIEAPQEVTDAFQIVCKYLLASTGELSEIRFTNIGDGIKIDLIASKFYPAGSMDDSSSFP